MRIAVVGATGMVGEIMLKVLAERNFPVTELIPVASEKSIGKEKTDELAVMIDPFRPLMITEEALLIEDENYQKYIEEKRKEIVAFHLKNNVFYQSRDIQKFFVHAKSLNFYLKKHENFTKKVDLGSFAGIKIIM